ncbi:MAG: hypothetical protein PUF04_09665 [bacterium]|nr:hypothetical protein [bacterium]
MAKKHTDILQQKTKKLKELTEITDNALSVITGTISGLELINQEIDDTVAEIDAYNSQMLTVKDSLVKNRAHNAQIIRNFTKLLSE